MQDKERTSPPVAIASINGTDIWSDGTETASDRRLREFTLDELETSRKTLPKEGYEALVQAVGEILRSHYEREEEVRESVRTKIAEFKDHDETLKWNRGESVERKDAPAVERTKAKYHFYTKTDGKYYEREGNKVSKDFAAITNGASLSEFRNEEIADVFSYAYVHSNKEYPLGKESERIPDAIMKIKARFARDPAWLVAISEGWGGHLSKTKPSIDTRLQVGDTKGIKKEFITMAKEAFKEASANVVDDFVKRQLGKGADAEKIAEVFKKIKNAVENTPADAQSNYFNKVGAKIGSALQDAWAKPITERDNLQFIRQMLEVTVASRDFDVKNDPKESKYFAAFRNCKNEKDVEAVKARLLSANPGDKASIEKCAGTKILSLASESVASFWGPRISETASKAAFLTAGPATPENFRKQAERIIQSEKSLADLEEKSAALRNAGPIKSFEDMTDAELLGMKASLDGKRNPTDEDRTTSEALAKYLKDRLSARREFVALATGKTYEEVLRLERSGRNLEALFEQAKKEPVFNNRKSAAEISQNGNDSGIPPFADDFRGRIEMGIGQSYEFHFSETSAKVEITKTDDAQNPYRVSVDGKESFACNEKNLGAHIDMAKLLCDNGLEFLAPVSREMLKRVSIAQGNLATAEDGIFTDREKRLLLSGFASAFEIGGFPSDAVETSRMETCLKTFATERSTTFRDLGMRSKILDENGNVRNRDDFFSKLGG